jgi:hypothetical protein
MGGTTTHEQSRENTTRYAGPDPGEMALSEDQAEICGGYFKLDT